MGQSLFLIFVQELTHRRLRRRGIAILPRRQQICSAKSRRDTIYSLPVCAGVPTRSASVMLGSVGNAGSSVNDNPLKIW